MAKKNKVEVTKIEKPLIKLNATFNDMLDKISTSSNERDNELSNLMKIAHDAIDGEVDGLNDITGDDISTFIVKVFNEIESFEDSINRITSVDDIFNAKDGSVMNLFKARYKNRNFLLEDLNVIYNQLYELEEAVMTTRDGIVTADDVSQTVARTIKVKHDRDRESNSSFVSMIEQMEKDLKLFNKIKNHIVPKTLQFGSYYAYTIPYSKIFADHTIAQQKQIQMESFTANDFNVKNSNDVVKEYNTIMENYTLYTDLSIVLTENASALNGLSDEEFKKVTKKYVSGKNKGTGINASVDGTLDTSKIESDFKSIRGCYIELIHPTKVVPVRVLEQTLGYYYIIDQNITSSASAEVSKVSPFTTTLNTNVAKQREQQDLNENEIVTNITNKIVKSFNKPFLEENKAFKDLMANTLLHESLYKKKLKFIYIPVEYMTEFKVNEDENGEGTSMLLRSLFNAKLYLALLIFKVLSIVTLSNDTLIYYIKQGIDKNVSNKIQDVARSVKQKQINWDDLMDYSSMVNKVGKGKNIFMPIGQSGERGIEFDVMQGQDVQLNNELMESLRTGYISATGVPSVIMNYINEADYAKTLVMANAKHLGRVVSYQLDFNPTITEFYRKIASFCLPIDEEIVNTIEFAFIPPKSLNNMNMTDIINNAEQTIMYMVKSVTGENANPTEDDNVIKDLLFDKLSRELLPMLPWDVCDKIYKESKLELENHKLSKPEQTTEE